MSRTTSRVAIGAALLTTFFLLSIESAQAQSNRMRATIPFAFYSAEGVLPSGDYDIERLGSGVAKLFNRDTHAVVVFDDERGAVFQPDQPGIATLVSPTGSMLRLTNALVGSHALVLTLPLFAVPPSQTVKVTPVDWPTSGDGQRTWMTAGPSNELVRYVVGGLVPNGAYVVRKGSVPVAVVTADASGTIAFSNAPGTTRPVTYSVAPVGSLVDPPIVSLPPHDNHGHATATETATTISKEQQRRGA